MSCLNFIRCSFHFSFPRMCASFYSYRVVKEVGDGTFGWVWRVVNKFPWRNCILRWNKIDAFSTV